MKITIYQNDTPTEREIPTTWKEIPFELYLKLIGQSDIIKVLCIILDIEREVFLKSRVVNFESVLGFMEFIFVPPAPYIPEFMGNYKIADKLENRTVGQYADLKAILDENAAKDMINKFPLMCAIYAQDDYDFEKAEILSNWFAQQPCEEVLGIGNFTLLRWIVSKHSTDQDSRKTTAPLRKWRLVLATYLKNMVSSARWYIWKRKHLTS